MKRTLWLLGFILIHTTLLYSQKEGNKMYENLGYLTATDLYQDLENEDQTYEIKLKLANSFRLNSEFAAAEYWYAQLINEVQEKETILQYAQMLQANGKCEDAIRWYKMYKEQSSDKTLSFITDCEEIKKFNNHRDIELTNASALNSSAHDFSPIPYKDGIVFTSMRGQERGGNKAIDNWTKSNFSDLFYAAKKETSFDKPKAMKGDVNEGYHDGVATFSTPTKTMFFTRTSREKSEEGEIKQLKIYSAKGDTDNWEDTEELNFNNKEFSTCHPTLSTDGQRLYFSSDRPGGFGGMDLYVSQKIGSKWADPVNLGPTVNTSGNEIFPFVDARDKLFFASNGHKGLGGLDIFVVEKSDNTDENSFADRKNLGKPFNSKKDDFGFYINESETGGYLSSNRPGGAGADDIYEWKKTEKSKKDDIDPFDPNPNNSNEIVNASGTSQIKSIAVCNAKTGERLKDARVAILKAADNWVAYEDAAAMPTSILTNNPNGDFGVKVNGGVIRADASFVSNENGTFSYPINTAQSYAFYAEKERYYPARQQLTGAQLLENVDYCIPLSPRDCIRLKGTVKNKNFPKYIGGAALSFIDKCTGAITTMVSDFDGKFETCIECNCEYEIIARKLNFKEGKTILSTLSVPCSAATIMNTQIELELDRLNPNDGNISSDYVNEYFTGDPNGNYKVGQEITLNDIYYDFDKDNIRADAATDLDYLVLVMNEYPSMEISLTSHTDSRGETDYNRWLSRNRSKSAKNFLINKGIATYRIKGIRGYGETQPVNDCYDGIECSEEEHQRNRRTVVTITRLDEPVKVNTVARPKVIDRKSGL